MKSHITAYIDRFSGQGQNSTPVSLEQLIATIKAVSEQKYYQSIALHDGQLLRTQINLLLDDIDFTTLLNPSMPNLGGMEVMATIKRDLCIELETMLVAQNH